MVFWGNLNSLPDPPYDGTLSCTGNVNMVSGTRFITFDGAGTRTRS